jgi:stage V sporulation protein B
MSEQDQTRSAGRGGLAVTGAKVYFILLGLVQQIVLPRVLGLNGYGALSRVLSLASITYNPITTMSIQAVSRTVVQTPAAELPGTLRKVLTLHLAFGVLLPERSPSCRPGWRVRPAPATSRRRSAS